MFNTGKRLNPFKASSGRKLKRVRSIPRKTSMATMVRRVLENSEEKKYIETQAVTTDMPAAGSTVLLNAVAEGTDFNQRIGRKVRVKYIYYDVSVEITTAGIAAVASLPVAWHLVLDRQSNNATAGYGTIFDTSIISEPFCFKNDAQFEKRFKILKSNRTVIGSSVTGNQLYRESGWIPFEKMDPEDQMVQYTGSTAVAPNKNALLIAFASNEGASNYCQINYGIRVVYVDM